MERTVSDALEMLRLTFDHSTTNEDGMLKAYASYSKTYDTDYESVFHYNLPAKVAEVLMKNVVSKTDGKLLDVGCGTGLVGEKLRNLGFEGTIHGIDASPEMLAVAMKKKMVYDEVFTQFLSVGTPIKAASSNFYDGIICVGTITKNHLHPEILKDFLPLLVKDGLVIATITNTSYNQEVAKQMNESLKQLEKSKKIYDVKISETQSFDIQPGKIVHGFKSEDFNDSSKAIVFSLRKL